MKLRGSEKLEKLLVDFTDSLTEARGRSGELDGREMDDMAKEDPKGLLKTIVSISSIIQPKEPSENLLKKVSDAALGKFDNQLSTEKIQRIVGMAVTMEEFRRGLFHDIVGACRSVGFSLTPKEVAALRNLREDAVKEFANSLDERITKFFPTSLP